MKIVFNKWFNDKLIGTFLYLVQLILIAFGKMKTLYLGNHDRLLLKKTISLVCNKNDKFVCNSYEIGFCLRHFSKPIECEAPKKNMNNLPITTINYENIMWTLVFCQQKDSKNHR